MTVFTSRALHDRVAVVTGAARGIGRSTAKALAAAGADVAGIDICATATATADFAPASPDDLAETGRMVEAEGRRWLPLQLDQRDMGALREAAGRIEAAFGGVDIVFANAGVQAFKPILEMEDADWRDQIDINLTGAANVLRVFAPLLVRRGRGRIVITSSTQGQHGTLNGAAYSASKWGLIGLMKSAALELGPKNITVNCVIPGLIDTALTRHEDRYAQALRSSGKDPSGDEAQDEKAAAEGLASKLPARIPWLEPDAVAPAVVFLASDAAAMISGTSLAVTGGDSANVTA